MLQAQDRVVVLAIVAYQRGRPLDGPSWTYVELASWLGLSASRVHKSVRRAIVATLMSQDGKRVIQSALVELLIHGVRYVYPPERGPLARGIPTSISASPIQKQLTASAGSTPVVWPSPRGTARGQTLTPLIPSAPDAAMRDPHLHALLAVVDVLRSGGAPNARWRGDAWRRSWRRDGRGPIVCSVHNRNFRFSTMKAERARRVDRLHA